MSARLRIVIAEDDPIISMLLADVLGGLGYDVCAVVATEEGAVAAAVRYNPDVMVVDAILGQGSGVAAVREVSRERRVPHVFLTGDAAAVLKMSPESVVVEKPANGADLARAIERALRVGDTRP